MKYLLYKLMVLICFFSSFVDRLSCPSLDLGFNFLITNRNRSDRILEYTMLIGFIQIVSGFLFDFLFYCGLLNFFKLNSCAIGFGSISSIF